MKLGARLIIYLVLLVILTMVVFGYLTIRQDWDNSMRYLKLGMSGFSQAIQQTLDGIYGVDESREETKEFIDLVAPRGSSHWIIVYDRAGALVTASTSLEGVKVFPQIQPEPALETGEASDGFVKSGGQLLYYRLQPIFNLEGKVVGAFVLGRQAWEVARTITTRNHILATTAVLILLLCLSILIIVDRNVSRPIKELIERIREVGKGHWEQRIDASGRDEVSSLAQEFNRMSERLQNIYARLIKEQEEKLQLERSLRHSEKLASVGRLTAGLAHEIGTPLNIIGGRAEYLLRRPRTPAETHENLGIIRSQIDRIVGIVRQLLEFSRRKEPALRMVDLHSLLKEVTGLLQHKIDEKNIEVRMLTAGPLPTIMADPDLLQQVFINLCLNSLDVLDAGDRIEIRAETEDRSWLRISFEDNGPGIPPEEIGQVFDPFYTTKDVGEGTGLGLSVTYGIVKDHGGDIKVESEPGRFTRFIIRLPLLDGTQPAENERLLM